MALQLREVDPLDPADKALREMFEACKSHVVRVATSEFYPNTVALTTAGGFVQVVDISTGEFRIFLTFLDNLPLESVLRCFSLCPALHTGAADQFYIVFSLAYSNELLCGETSSGGVSRIATLTSRPSAVFCDGDYIGCGDGSGELVLWTAADERKGLRQKWRCRYETERVVMLLIHRDVLLCAMCDFRFHVISLHTGTSLSTFSGISAAQLPVALLSLDCCGPLGVALVTKAALTLVTPSDSSRTAVWRTAFSMDRLPDDSPPSCASVGGSYVVCGALDGSISVYRLINNPLELRELVSFEVGCEISAVQLFGGETVVVITATGDVWRWPLTDILGPLSASEEEGDDGARSASDEDHYSDTHGRSASLHTPRPSPFFPTPTYLVPGGAAHPEMGHDDGEDDDDENDYTIVDMEDETRLPHDDTRSSEGPHEESQHTVEGEGYDYRASLNNSVPSSVHDMLHESARQEADIDESLVTIRSTVSTQHTNFAGDSYESEDVHTQRAANASHPMEDAIAHHVHGKPTATGNTRKNASDSSPSEASHRIGNTAAEGRHSNPSSTSLVQRPSDMQEVMPKRDVAAGQSEFVLNGLRKGRRMDPRKAERLVHSAANQQIPDASDEFDPATERPQNSTVLLKKLQEETQAQSIEAEVKNLVDSNALVVEGLKFQYPIKPTRFDPQDTVFQMEDGALNVNRIEDKRNTPHGDECLSGDAEDRRESGGGGGTRGSSRQDAKERGCKAVPHVADDLINATFLKFTRKRDESLEMERRSGKPDIWQHLCDDLLFPGPNTDDCILFDEGQIRPPAPMPLLLPMPLPPTPSVF